VQLVEAVLSSGESEFAGQASQTADPASALNVPAAHCEHVPPAGPVHPALQVQSNSSSLASGESEFVGQASHPSDVEPATVEYLPATQLLHAACPGAFLYVPAVHCMHIPPAGPVHPALQVQSTSSSLASDELELPGHVEQAAEPLVSLKVPGLH